MTTAIPPLPRVSAAALHAGNVARAPKLAEKTIELTTCAQFGRMLARDMVWFGLTQKQERQYAFDASTSLGGRAFILQFKVSSTVLRSGPYAGQRKFHCQHDQMSRLRAAFGSLPNSCFYFLPNIGTFSELVGVSGDVIGNSFLVDVADLPNPIPATQRRSGYHYAYLDAAGPSVIITSEPFAPRRVVRAREFTSDLKAKRFDGRTSEELIAVARRLEATNARLGDLFFKNAALVVVP